MIFLRGRRYYVKFRFKGRLVRESTYSTDYRTALEIEKTLRNRLALEYARTRKLDPSKYPKVPGYSAWEQKKFQRAIAEQEWLKDLEVMEAAEKRMDAEDQERELRVMEAAEKRLDIEAKAAERAAKKKRRK